MMDSEAQDGLEALRKFLRPTLRGWFRKNFLRLKNSLFPPKPTPLFRTGDMITMNDQEFEIGRVQGRVLHLTNGAQITV
jgi:hypothetical protein